VRFLRGDIRDAALVEKSLQEVDYVVHLAAETGVGQSAYEIARYVSVNELGTAIILEEAAKKRDQLKGIILASSRAVYGEGRYECEICGIVYPCTRQVEDMSKGIWNPLCPECRGVLNPLLSIEEQDLRPVSVYGITKLNQEHLLCQCSQSYEIPGVSLRFQNVYGPGQSLSNPYTGILAIFSTRILAGNSISIYEDGKPLRDFVYVGDVVCSMIILLRRGFTGYNVYNVGTGIPVTILEVAEKLIACIGRRVPVNLEGKYRIGDIRNAWADISRLRENIGYIPMTSFESGLSYFVQWVRKQPISADRFSAMEQELKNRNLLKSYTDEG
jgi:dTDP-L-rhamnose 4-epimerase